MKSGSRLVAFFVMVLFVVLGLMASESGARAEEAQTCEDQESEYCRSANCNWSCVYWLEDETRCEADCSRTEI